MIVNEQHLKTKTLGNKRIFISFLKNEMQIEYFYGYKSEWFLKHLPFRRKYVNYFFSVPFRAARNEGKNTFCQIIIVFFVIVISLKLFGSIVFQNYQLLKQ